MSLHKTLEFYKSLHKSTSLFIPSALAELYKIESQLRLQQVSLLRQPVGILSQPGSGELLDQIMRVAKALPEGELKETFRNMKIRDILTYKWETPEEAEQDPEPILIDATAHIKKAIADIYADQAMLHKVDPRLFEEIIAELLASQGLEVELTRKTKDGGYDIMAIRKMGGFKPLKFLVECKHYTGGVGVNVVRAFHSVVLKEEANRGILVTSSYYTRGVFTEVGNPWLLDFKEKNDILDWVQDYYTLHKGDQ